MTNLKVRIFFEHPGTFFKFLKYVKNFPGLVGIPSDDLDEPGMEVTEADHYFTDNNTKKEKNPSVSDFVNAEVGVIREALEIIAIYGKSLKIEVDNKEATDLLQDETTIAPEVEEATKAKPETFEVNSKIFLNVKRGTQEIKFGYKWISINFEVQHHFEEFIAKLKNLQEM